MENAVVHYGLLGIHLVVGFVLVYIGTRAFKKTKYPPMALLALGFSLIVIGDTILGDILPFVEENVIDLVEEVIEISGFIILIIAVKRS